MLKGVIFDMDGVLVNSEPMHDKAYQRMFEKEFHKTLPPNYFMPFIGTTNATVYDALRRDFQITQTNAEMDVLVRRYNRVIIDEEGYEGIEGIPELLHSLKQNGMVLSVASSSPMASILEVTKALKIASYFDYMVSGENVPNSKPAPDVFLKAAKEMGLNERECLVVEDSMNGVNAAQAANMPCIGFINPDSGNQNLVNAAILVEGFEEVDYSFVSNVYKKAMGEPITMVETERLIIREITVEDLDELYAIYVEPSITKYMENLYEKSEEIDFTKAYIKNMYGFYGYGLWVVVEKDSNKIIGRAGLSNREVNGNLFIELGYMIGVPYQKKGYAFEACQAILSFAVTKLEISMLQAFCEPENIASQKLAEKLGFVNIDHVSIEEKAYFRYEWTEK